MLYSLMLWSKRISTEPARSCQHPHRPAYTATYSGGLGDQVATHPTIFSATTHPRIHATTSRDSS